MEELISVMEEIKDLLFEMNGKLDDIHNDISEISTNGVYNISDICNKLDEISGGINDINLTIT